MMDSLGLLPRNRDVRTPHVDQIGVRRDVLINHYWHGRPFCMASSPASVMTGMLE